MSAGLDEISRMIGRLEEGMRRVEAKIDEQGERHHRQVGELTAMLGRGELRVERLESRIGEVEGWQRKQDTKAAVNRRWMAGIIACSSALSSAGTWAAAHWQKLLASGH
jgi:hypothetical protein